MRECKRERQAPQSCPCNIFGARVCPSGRCVRIRHFRFPATALFERAARSSSSAFQRCRSKANVASAVNLACRNRRTPNVSHLFRERARVSGRYKRSSRLLLERSLREPKRALPAHSIDVVRWQMSVNSCTVASAVGIIAHQMSHLFT